ncbi:MAG: hypothetical protein AB7G37_19805 [Solirubrobacteraceae bacterium]
MAVATGPALLEPTQRLRDAITANGAVAAPVDLTSDDRLPDGTIALVLGDGAPIPHADRIGANAGLRDAVRAHHGHGRPIVAEGAGIAFLAESLDGHPMCDLLPVTAGPGRGGVPGAVELLATADGPVHGMGERCIGRPSAAVVLDLTTGERPAWTIGRRTEGWIAPGLHASLVVVDWTATRVRSLLAAAGVDRD